MAEALVAPTPGETGALVRARFDEAATARCCPAARTLRAFLRDSDAYATEPRCPDTNYVDQGECRTYAFPPAVAAEMMGHLEACRRAGTACHMSERQVGRRAGLLVDLDMVHRSPEPVFGEDHAHQMSVYLGTLFGECLAMPARGSLYFHAFYTRKPRPVPTQLPEAAARLAEAGAAGAEAGAAGASEAGDAAAPHRVSFAQGTKDGPAGGAPGGPVFRDGVHVVIPDLLLTREAKRLLLRRLHESGAVPDVLEEIPLAQDPDQVLDQATASSPILMFGSAKRGRSVAYGLLAAHRVRVRPRPGQPAVVMPERMAAEALDRANLVAELSLLYPAAYPDGRQPLVAKRDVDLVPALQAEIDAAATAGAGGAAGGAAGPFLEDHGLNALVVVDPEAQYLHEVLALLPVDRFVSDYGRWRDVIFALANTSDSYRPLADWFTARDPRKTAAAGSSRPRKLADIWGAARDARARGDGGLTKRSIFHWAKTEAPDRFRAVAATAYYNVLGDFVFAYAGRLQHAHVAALLRAMLGGKFCVDVDEDGRATWYEFVMPGQPALPGQAFKWRLERDPAALRLYMTDRLPAVYSQLEDNLEERRDAAADNAERAKFYKRLIGAVAASKGKLWETGYQRGVIEQAALRFRIRGFGARMDAVPDVMGVSNGVWRLARAGSRAPGADARAGPGSGGARAAPDARPRNELVDRYHEYPVSKFTPVPAVPYDAGSRRVRVLLKAIDDIFPEADAREWKLMYLSTGLSRGPKAPVMLMSHGGGANAKSWCSVMTANALGPYGSMLRSELLVRGARTDSGRPDSALMRMKGLGYGFTDELRQGDLLDDAKMKLLVNTGKISGRDLNSREEVFSVTATLEGLSNFRFEVITTDHGTWRRLRFYEHKVTFCDNPDPGNPYEKKIDRRYIDEYANDPEWLAAWLSILGHYWERLQSEYGGDILRVPCATIDRETADYRKTQDTVHRYVLERIVVSPSAGLEYSLDSLSARYTEWFKRVVNDRGGLTPASATSRIENSILRDYVRRRPNGVAYVAGVRLLDDGEGDLGPDERYFVS